MFHVSPAYNRASIQQGGLDKNKSGLGKRVYLSDEEGANLRARDGGYDIWKVDTSGIPLREDKIDGGAARYAQRSISPDRIGLHKPGAGQ
jgi:hypothetical protein